MPRFHLHQHRDNGVILDEEGGEYRSLEDAIGEAAQAAREMLADCIRSGEPLGRREFHIVDEAGGTAAVVSFDDVLAAGSFPPPPPGSSD
jgi:hypothetical protein